jgi:accessory gene regulator B
MRNINEDYIRYGMEIFLGALLQIVILLSIAWVLGIIKPTAAIVCASGFYRRLAGGAHCGRYYRCTIFSIIHFVLLAYLCGIIEINYYFAYFALALFASMTVIYLRVPVDNDIKPILDSSHRRRLQVKSYFVAGIFLLASLFAHFYYQDMLATGFLLGLIWESFNLTRWGIFYTQLWDRALNNLEKNLWGRREYYVSKV